MEHFELLDLQKIENFEFNPSCRIVKNVLHTIVIFNETVKFSCQTRGMYCTKKSCIIKNVLSLKETNNTETVMSSSPVVNMSLDRFLINV